ncbi:MAG: hypothetical protein GXP47_01700 [Acidobacteria bacterium]|nr:hypothetical protein [Acidobacteriota bacterium]
MRRSLLLTLILTVLVAGSVFAIDPWEYHQRLGERLFAYGRTAQAEAELKKALKIAGAFPPGDRRLEATLEDLGKLYENQERVDKAQAMYSLLLAAVEARAGKDSPELLPPLAAAGRTALAGGDVPTAKEDLNRYAALAAQTGAADLDRYRSVLEMLSRMAAVEGDFDTALARQREAVAQLGKGTATDEERSVCLESLAQLELAHGSAEAGARILRKVAGLQAADPGLGNPATTLVKGAQAAMTGGDPGVAAGLARAALKAGAAGEEALAARSIAAGAAWRTIGAEGVSPADLLGTRKDDPEVAAVRQCLEELEAIQKERLGPADPRRITTLGRLSRLAAMEGDAEGALQYLSELGGAASGSNNPSLKLNVLEDRAGLLRAAGRTDEAIEANSELIAALESAHGPNDPALLPALRSQEALLRTAKRKKEARKIHKRLRRLERTLRKR